jgi:hypothetical protein
MKNLLIAMTACAALVFFAHDALALAPGSGNAMGGAQDGSGQPDKKVEGSRDGNSNRDNGNVNSKESVKSNVNRDNNESGANVGRGAFVNRSEKLGDRDFDKHRIGALDESKYKDRRDNNWRYRHWGEEWWYWVPEGYWMYWHNGRWIRYDDSYVDSYQNDNPQNASFHGPYYEDDKGFYYMENGRRVYDPQIRRMAS